MPEGRGWPLAGLTAHLLQAGDAFFQRRVRAEQVGHAAAAEAEQQAAETSAALPDEADYPSE